MEQLRVRNPYADHLVEVNRNNPVITTQDICNSKGATVIPEGTYITEDVANKIAKFNLSIPIELQVSLAATLSPNEMYSAIHSSQKSYFGSGLYPEASKELISQCGLLHAYPLVSQKLTVFADRMPEKYVHTQSATGFAVLIGMQLGLDEVTLEVVFAATQMHDAGFLNIDEDMAKVIDQLPEVESRDLFSQQLLLGKVFLDKVPNLSKRVGQAVLEHKERKDGSGWPKGMIGDKQSIECQVVGLAVMLSEAYAQKLKPRGYQHRHLLPLVQIESEGVEDGVYGAVIDMLRQNAHSNAVTIPSEFISPLAGYLIVLQRTLIHWLGLAKQLSIGMQETLSTPDIERPLIIISSLEELYRNSGLWEEHLRLWLADVESSGTAEDYSEVEVVALMFESILSKLKRLQWSLREAAKHLGGEWLIRSDDLAFLIHNLPNDIFEAFEKYMQLD
jgi:hypothetical protein